MKTITLGKPRIYEPSLPAVTVSQPGHFLVYYDGSAAALAALKTAISLAERGTAITAISFVSVPRSQPLNMTLPHLETRAKVVLAAAVANAALFGIEIGTEIIQCHAIGPALV